MGNRGSRSGRRAHKSNRSFAVWPLEPRQLFSIAVLSKTSTLEITGTSADDAISVNAVPNLMNVVRVVMSNATSREEEFINTGRFRTIRISAGKGNDQIKIDHALSVLHDFVTVDISGGSGNDNVTDCPLSGRIDLGDGDDRVTTNNSWSTAPETPTTKAPLVYRIDGGAGNDRIVTTDGDSILNGGEGSDTITSGWGEQTISGGSGNDHISAHDRSGRINGDGGNDQIDNDGGNPYVPAVIHGGDGDDSILIEGSVTSVSGDDGNDRITANTGFDGATTLSGGGGDDMLDGGWSFEARLDGGAGNDSLSAKAHATAIGGPGADWFDPKGSWASTDWSKADAGRGKQPSLATPSTGDSSGVSGTGDWALANLPGPADPYNYEATIALVGLGQSAYLVASINFGVSSGLPTIYPAGGRFVRGIGDGQFAPPDAVLPRPAATTVDLTKTERSALHPGIVELPAGWKLSNATPIARGQLEWFDLRYGKGGDLARAKDIGIAYQLCVAAGTLIITGDGGYVPTAQPIASANFNADALWMPATGTVQVVGGATYELSGNSTSGANLVSPKRHGLAVAGGVLLLASGAQQTTFVAQG